MEKNNFYLVNTSLFSVKSWGVGLTLNVDHFGDQHSLIGASGGTLYTVV